MGKAVSMAGVALDLQQMKVGKVTAKIQSLLPKSKFIIKHWKESYMYTTKN